ncbi:hypothetical protein FC75_GL000552 [Lacticaseibacillus camelliae DSM 22697 = JCM 13995]|uniref:ABC transporter domain-containing protein n=1 Tax=Lacticaseibacillus camelliae DSM 22697 = JCM 13995 TaxID=1423730 RepID=A0A0R2F2Q9_9LACO|nr:hypothetical protein FC75_GL000552 [Lacticaseibacillus camelliae DSM 22697 = JCM 13995]
MSLLLEVKNLSFNYGKQPILDDLSFTIEAGTIVGLVAPNGTGKSTLLRNVTGLLRPKHGTVSLLGHDSWHDRQEFLKHLFFLEDSTRLYEGLNPNELFGYVKDVWGGQLSVDRVVKVLRMDKYRKKRVASMSLGMKQHVLLGMYLISGADLLLFDEPLNGLDPTSIELFTRVFSQLKGQGKSILMSSHQLGNVTTMADSVMFLKDAHLQTFQTAAIDLQQKYDELFAVDEKLLEP